MAIKGKGKTKSRQVARAPRREPVPVPVPFFLRRWVQVTLAFLIGIGAMVMVVWVTNGLRENDRVAEDEAKAGRQKAAAEEWRAVVDVQLGTVGSLQYPNAPLVGGELATVLGEMVRGEKTTVTAEELQEDADALRAAIKEIESYDLSKLIREADAFQEVQTEYLLTSRAGMAKALEAYRQATLTGIEALAAEDEQQVALATVAKRLADVGTDQMAAAWEQYLKGLRSAGVSIGLPGQDTGFPGLPTQPG